MTKDYSVDSGTITYAGLENTKNIDKQVKKEKIPGDSSKEKNYLQIHDDALLVDTHNDFIWKVFDKGADLGKRNPNTQSDIPRFKEGGLDVQVFAVWIPMNQVKKSFNFVVSQIDRLKNFETENPSDLEFAKTYDDVIRITNEKKICGLIGIEGGTAFGNNLDNINTFFELGVRYVGLTWNNSNLISTSARDATERGKQGGLTDFGIEVIKRMNETGMLIDVSHLSEEGFWDVIENTNSPIIASHSNCYSINPHYRNLTDEQIKAVAQNEGYIGINFYDKFLDKDGEKNGATIEKVIEHIDYIKTLVGIDYIGIGSDFDGGITPAAELYDASTYPLITKKLIEIGYSEEEIKKILGGNFLRVFKKVCG
ncbi:MAG: dipeptidase [Bacteroidota bacterium]|nr:dipeptidase [Bacteroidota bacterium]